jgi:hypothetical protein
MNTTGDLLVRTRLEYPLNKIPFKRQIHSSLMHVFFQSLGGIMIHIISKNQQ